MPPLSSPRRAPRARGSIPAPHRRGSATPPPSQPSAPAPGPTTVSPGLAITLPLEYTAFCQLHQEHYLHYTRARVRDPQVSQRVVETALGTLVTIWPTVISSSQPAAIAWQMLGSLIASALRTGTLPGPADHPLHRALPPLQADVVLLRHHLSLDDDQSADLMGVEVSTVASQLRTAHRNLPPPLEELLTPGA